MSALPRQSPITVRTVVSLYLADVARRVKAGELNCDLADRYERDLQAFVVQFGERPMPYLRQADMAEFLAAHPTWKSVTTKRLSVASVLACFRWACEEELIASCPYRAPRSLRGQIAETRRPATHTEFVSLMQCGSKQFRFALLFLYRTGCRTSEMRALTWDSVRLDGPSPHLYLAKHKTSRRTGRPRIVGLDGLTVRLLRAMRRTSTSRYVFLNTHGTPWQRSAWCHQFRATAIRAGLDDGTVKRVTAYCLRHTYACDAIESGLTSSQVAHQLGHATTTMVETIYSRHVGQKVGFISDVAKRIGDGRK